MFDSPFATLGVPENASIDQVKASYRSLALKWHPDMNPSPDAKERFIKVQDAYEQAIGLLQGTGYESIGNAQFTDDPAATSRARQAQGFGMGYWEEKKTFTPEEQHDKVLKNFERVKEKPNADCIYGILNDFDLLIKAYEGEYGQHAAEPKIAQIWEEKKNVARHFYDSFFAPEEVVPRIIGTTKDYASIVQTIIQDPRPETVYASLEQAILDTEKLASFVDRTGEGPAEDEMFQFSFFNANDFVECILPTLQEIDDTLGLDRESRQRRLNDIAISTLEGYRLKFNLASAVRERTGNELYRILFDANDMAEFYFQEFAKVAKFLNEDVSEVGGDLVDKLVNIYSQQYENKERFEEAVSGLRTMQESYYIDTQTHLTILIQHRLKHLSEQAKTPSYLAFSHNRDEIMDLSDQYGTDTSEVDKGLLAWWDARKHENPDGALSELQKELASANDEDKQLLQAEIDSIIR
jgi:hypothetical protein